MKEERLQFLVTLNDRLRPLRDQVENEDAPTRLLGEHLRQTQERHGFLLKLSDALRALSDPADVQETAARLLGEHLGRSARCSAGRRCGTGRIGPRRR